MSLFRKEALEQSYQRLWGNVTISQPLSYKVLSACTMMAVVIMGIFLFTSDFHRKERVRGYLVPSEGVIKLYSPERAYVTHINVNEGQQVQPEDVLFTLEMKRTLSNGLDMHQSSVHELNSQIRLLNTQIESDRLLYDSQKTELTLQLKNLQLQATHIQSQITFIQDRITLVEHRINNYEKLSKRGLLDQYSKEQQQELRLSLNQDKGELEALQVQVAQKIQTNQTALARLPLEKQKSEQTLQLQISERQQQLIQQQSLSKIQIKAQKAGRVTAILAKEGQLVAADALLASVIPKTASLYAELLIPTRAFGFVRAGQTTRLKFDAFPYQKFGILNGELFETSQVILLPNEVNLPIELQEPMYKVKVHLPQQTIQAYGEEMPLQAGMLLEADVLLEKRSVGEWLIEPLLSLKGT
ncbi:HlyD family efflux transporter periplasmic adaptor subunit [Algicola sagamiensis]|uniref:HlyD family efflux transporter periplasmic adaptor subunit n=1 Tax=Algicola sagamiensis TaxID=163869 RepID=UPI0003700981|nr:HlyD family efflux transporter periplasmic adaptor subunit [Algicola sagamiensis]